MEEGTAGQLVAGPVEIRVAAAPEPEREGREDPGEEEDDEDDEEEEPGSRRLLRLRARLSPAPCGSGSCSEDDSGRGFAGGRDGARSRYGALPKGFFFVFWGVGAFCISNPLLGVGISISPEVFLTGDLRLRADSRVSPPPGKNRARQQPRFSKPGLEKRGGWMSVFFSFLLPCRAS